MLLSLLTVNSVNNEACFTMFQLQSGQRFWQMTLKTYFLLAIICEQF